MRTEHYRIIPCLSSHIFFSQPQTFFADQSLYPLPGTFQLDFKSIGAGPPDLLVPDPLLRTPEGGPRSQVPILPTPQCRSGVSTLPSPDEQTAGGALRASANMLPVLKLLESRTTIGGAYNSKPSTYSRPPDDARHHDSCINCILLSQTERSRHSDPLPCSGPWNDASQNSFFRQFCRTAISLSLMTCWPINKERMLLVFGTGVHSAS